MPERDDDIRDCEADELEAELQDLVDAGLLMRVRRAGEPARYALSSRGGHPGARGGPRAKSRPALELVVDASDGVRASRPPRSEPCHYCGVDLGYDGGGRCLGCYVALPPEMA
jgi:hypothetical protein